MRKVKGIHTYLKMEGEVICESRKDPIRNETKVSLESWAPSGWSPTTTERPRFSCLFIATCHLRLGTAIYTFFYLAFLIFSHFIPFDVILYEIILFYF